jgi:hypothetical protein
LQQGNIFDDCKFAIFVLETSHNIAESLLNQTKRRQNGCAKLVMLATEGAWIESSLP